MEPIYLAETLYPAPIRELAIRAFAELCDMTITAAPGGVLVHIAPRNGAPDNLVDEFLSYVLTGALELHLLVKSYD
jgi:hypothetical protein